jgi:hypothetical protein
MHYVFHFLVCLLFRVNIIEHYTEDILYETATGTVSALLYAVIF